MAEMPGIRPTSTVVANGGQAVEVKPPGEKDAPLPSESVVIAGAAAAQPPVKTVVAEEAQPPAKEAAPATTPTSRDAVPTNLVEAPPSAPLQELAGGVAPTYGVLATQLNGLSKYESPYPKYTEYNVPPPQYNKLEEIDSAIDHPGQAVDARANSYSLGTYLGTEAQCKVIVAQQVLDVLNGLRHQSSDAEKFMSGLRMQEPRRKELAQLAPSLAPFRDMKDFGDIAKDKTLTQAVSTIVASTHNWGPQPEDFANTDKIVEELLNNKAFTDMANKECGGAEPMKGRPPVGILLRKLGYEGISNNLQEASMGVQAVDRLVALPANASGLAPIDALDKSPAPFPQHLADKIEPYAKDLQLGTKLLLGVANGLQSGKVKFNEAQMHAFDETRLKLAFLSAGELIGILGQETDHKDKIQGTIEQLQMKRLAISDKLGGDKVADLNLSSTSPEIRAKMLPLLRDSRALFEQALGQAASGEKRDAALKWVGGFADVTSMKAGSPAQAAYLEACVGKFREAVEGADPALLPAFSIINQKVEATAGDADKRVKFAAHTLQSIPKWLDMGQKQVQPDPSWPQQDQDFVRALHTPQVQDSLNRMYAAGYDVVKADPTVSQDRDRVLGIMQENSAVFSKMQSPLDVPKLGFDEANDRLFYLMDFFLKDHEGDPAITNSTELQTCRAIGADVQRYKKEAVEALHAAPADKKMPFQFYLQQAIRNDSTPENGPKWPFLWVAGFQATVSSIDDSALKQPAT